MSQVIRNTVNSFLFDKRKRSIVLLSGFFLLYCSDPVRLEQHKPIIHSISFDRSQIYIREFITIHAVVTEKDNDVIQYTWMADGGMFTNAHNNPTQWHAPAQPGTFTITLTVSDGVFTVSDAKQIIVISK